RPAALNSSAFSTRADLHLVVIAGHADVECWIELTGTAPGKKKPRHKPGRRADNRTADHMR
ncbi:MAG TPA: hypothetical protein VF237_04890, partial [Xanthobacteraceae bacterium]